MLVLVSHANVQPVEDPEFARETNLLFIKKWEEKDKQEAPRSLNHSPCLNFVFQWQ